MQSKKNKGQGTNFPKKHSDSRKLQSSMSKGKKHRLQEQHNSLASLSSPVNYPNKKKLSPVRKIKNSKKQASLSPLLEDSPEHKKGNSVLIVTAIKQSKESSEEEDSTGRASSIIQVKSSTPSGTSTTNPLHNMSVSDTKLKYVLKHWVFPNGLNHEI